MKLKVNENVELLSLIVCYWYLSSNPEKKGLSHDVNNAFILTAIIKETICFMKWFINKGRQKEDQDNKKKIFWGDIEDKSLYVNGMNTKNRTFMEFGLSHFI